MYDPVSLEKTLTAALDAHEPEQRLEIWSTLHTSYVDRHHKDNDRTWSTATWLVGVAWALFPAMIALERRLTFESAAVYAAASSALVLLWFAIASTHRVWASRSYEVVRALEQVVMGTHYESIRTALKEEHRVVRLLGPHPMRVLRWFIVGGTALAWIVMLILVHDGQFTPPPAARP